MNNKTPNFSTFLIINIVSILISLGVILTAFKYMPNVTNFISGLYFFFTLISYTGLIWFLLSVLCLIVYKIFNTLLAPSLLIVFSIMVLFLDIKVYALYRYHLSRGLLEYILLEASGELKRVIYTQIVPIIFVFSFFVLITYFLLKFFIKKLNKRLRPLNFHLFYAGFLFFFLISQIAYVYVDVINYIPIKKWTKHIPLYQPLTARRALIKLGVINSSHVRNFEIKFNYKDSSINYPKELKCGENNVKPNILWIFIDSWRFKDYNKKTTPNIYKWAQTNGTHAFKNHWSVGSATAPSLFSVFYGIPGFHIKSFTESGVAPIFISKLLKENYELQISTGWPIDSTSFSRNIFKEVPNLRMNLKEKKAWKIDAYMKDEVFSFLQKRNINKPYFSFIIFDSAHDYSVPDNYDAPFKPYGDRINHFSLGPNTDPKEYHNRYKNSVYYIDSIIGKILSSPLIQDSKRPSVILITSDHGEEFNDLKKNFWGHNSNFSTFQLRVPMFINWNGHKSKFKTDLKSKSLKKDFKHMTTHNDISHTFLENVFNCLLSPQQSVGFNLYSLKKRFPLLVSTYSRHGILTEDKIYSYERTQGYEVYDYNYNELKDQNVPKQIFKKYLRESVRFYN